MRMRGEKREEEKHTLLEMLKAFKGDFEEVLVGELGGVVHDIDPEKRDDRHLGGGGVAAWAN